MHRPHVGRGNPLKASLRSKMRSEEAQRVSKFRAKRDAEGTNPMNKALYVRAMVDAQEQLAHRRQDGWARRSGLVAPESPLVPAQQLHRTAADAQLQLLAKDLEATYHHAPTSSISSRHTEEDADSPVHFGAWREVSSGTPSVDRKLKYQLTALHCIVDGALTPAAYASVALRAGLPTEAASKEMRGIVQCIQRASSGRQHGFARAAALLGDALVPRLLSKLSTTTLSDRGQEGRGQQLDSQQKLLCDVLGRCGAVHWRLGVEVLSRVIAADGPVAGCVHRHRSSQDWAAPGVTVMLEAIRRHHGHRAAAASATPPREVLECIATHVAPPLIERRTGVAPLLALVDHRWTWEQVLNCCTKFACVPTSGNSTLSRAVHGSAPPTATASPGGRSNAVYLPPIALGQLLRALHRTDAPLARIQTVIDCFTDATGSKNAASHMKHHHVYAGYVSGAPWLEALEVYSNRAPYYGAPRTALLTASAMQALRCANDDGTGHLDTALRLYASLRKEATNDGMITRTSGTVCEALDIWRCKLHAKPDASGATQNVDDLRSERLRLSMAVLLKELGALSLMYGYDSSTVPASLRGALQVSELDGALTWLRQLQDDAVVAPRAVVAGLRLLNAIRSNWEEGDGAAEDEVTSGSVAVPPPPPKHSAVVAELSVDMLADLMAS